MDNHSVQPDTTATSQQSYSTTTAISSVKSELSSLHQQSVPQQVVPHTQTVNSVQSVQSVQATQAAAAQQPPPQHIQYNIDEGTLRKFCQPYNMEELVKMITNTAYINKDFYDILVSEMKKTSKWCKLFVHGLPWTTTQETLYATFARFGQIQECVILRDRQGQSKGFGFVNYTNADDAMRAIAAGPQSIDGRTVGSDLAWRGRKNRSNSGGSGGGGYRGRNHSGGGGGGGGYQGASARFQNSGGGVGGGGPLAARRLFVYSLLYTTTDDTLRAVFSQYGELEEAVIIKDKNNELKSKGYGFVIYKNARDAEAALREPHKNIDGRTVHVSLAINGRNNDGDGGRHGGHAGGGAQHQGAMAGYGAGALGGAGLVNTSLGAMNAAALLQQQQVLQQYDPYQQVLYSGLTGGANAPTTQLLQQLLAQQIQQQQMMSGAQAQAAQINAAQKAAKSGNAAPPPINPNEYR